MPVHHRKLQFLFIVLSVYRSNNLQTHEGLSMLTFTINEYTCIFLSLCSFATKPVYAHVLYLASGVLVKLYISLCELLCEFNSYYK